MHHKHTQIHTNTNTHKHKKHNTFQKIPAKIQFFSTNFKIFPNKFKIYSQNFTKTQNPPPPTCIFSALRHFFCFILGVGLKKICKFFSAKNIFCAIIPFCLWVRLANEWQIWNEICYETFATSKSLVILLSLWRSISNLKCGLHL